MTREEMLDWLYRLRSQIYVYMPKDWLIPMKDALDMAIKALEQEPKTGHWIYNDECHEHGHCSECGYGRIDLVDGQPHNFCRRCGAKMVEPQESEDKE